MICRRCGNKEDVSSVFCSNCGLQLKAQGAAPQNTQTNVNSAPNQGFQPRPTQPTNNQSGNSKNAKFTYVQSSYGSRPQNTSMPNQAQPRTHVNHSNSNVTQVKTKKSNTLRNTVVVLLFLALVALAVYLVVQNRNRRVRESTYNLESFLDSFNNSESEATERENQNNESSIDLNTEAEDRLIMQTFEELENGLNNGDAEALQNSISPGFFNDIPLFGDLFENIPEDESSDPDENPDSPSNSMFQFEVIDIDYTSNTSAVANVAVSMDMGIIDPIQTENQVTLEKVDGRWVIDLNDFGGLDFDLDIPDGLLD